MARYVLRFTGQGPRPSSDVERICAVPGLAIIRDALPDALLVECSEGDLASRLVDLRDWAVETARTTTLGRPSPSLWYVR